MRTIFSSQSMSTLPPSSRFSHMRICEAEMMPASTALSITDAATTSPAPFIMRPLGPSQAFRFVLTPPAKSLLSASPPRAPHKRRASQLLSKPLSACGVCLGAEVSLEEGSPFSGRAHEAVAALSLPLAEHNLLLIRSEATTQGGARAPLSSPPLAPEEGAQGVAGEAKGMAVRDAVATRPMMRTARGKDTGFTDQKHA